jgi:tRNA pseudouridine38-40 synthase
MDALHQGVPLPPLLRRPPPAWATYCWEVRADARLGGATVAVEAFASALHEAKGTRDFFAFHAASSPRRPRTLSEVDLRGAGGGLYELRLRGTGFGRYQVRALVGGAALRATGQLAEETWRGALDAGARFAGMLAPARGLTLWALDYGGLGPFDGECLGHLPAGPPFESVGPA